MKDLIGHALVAAEFSYRSAWQKGIVSLGDPCGAFVCVRDLPDALEVAFRGTDAANDWGKNLRAYPWRYNGAWVHRGFMTAHQTVWPWVAAELQRRGFEKPLRVIGHSYGGALAELTCQFLADYPQPVSLVTFGKPNVYLKPRAKRFPFLEHQISVVHGSDLVARIPWALYGPDLGQTLVYLANDGDTYVFPPDKLDAAACELLDGDWSWREGILSDHPLRAYRERLVPYLKSEIPT
jgi:pimeloyl-ACP methyl ester carboxylesterase